MARVFTVVFEKVSVSAAQDLVGIYTGANAAIKVHSFEVGMDAAAPNAQNLSITLRRMSGTITPGSGGATPTPSPTLPNSASPQINSAHTNDTTQATQTGGSSLKLHAGVVNLLNGYVYMPPPDDRVVIAPNQALIVSLDTSPGAATSLTGTLVYEELW
jgi:hypothetical protein